MPRRRYQRCFYEIVRWVTAAVARLGFGLRISGREQWPGTGGGLVCANHQSYLDPVLVGLACPRQLNFLARKSLFDTVWLRWLIVPLNAIPIDREGSGLRGLRESLRRLRDGELVLLFPEGTRTADGEVQPLQAGFISVARRGRSPIVPVGIAGAFSAWPRQRRWPRFCRIAVCVGPPLWPEQIERLPDEELLQEVSQRMTQAHREACRLRGC